MYMIHCVGAVHWWATRRRVTDYVAFVSPVARWTEVKVECVFGRVVWALRGLAFCQQCQYGVSARQRVTWSLIYQLILLRFVLANIFETLTKFGKSWRSFLSVWLDVRCFLAFHSLTALHFDEWYWESYNRVLIYTLKMLITHAGNGYIKYLVSASPVKPI